MKVIKTQKVPENGPQSSLFFLFGAGPTPSRQICENLVSQHGCILMNKNNLCIRIQLVHNYIQFVL